MNSTGNTGKNLSEVGEKCVLDLGSDDDLVT